MFKVNEGTADRVIRIILGVVAAALAYRHTGGAVGTWILGIVAVLAIVTGAVGSCLVYRLFGISTCRVRQ